MPEPIRSIVVTDSDLAHLGLSGTDATILLLPGEDWADCTVPGPATMYGDGNNTVDHWGWPDGASIQVLNPTRLPGRPGWYLVVSFHKEDGASAEYGLVFRYMQRDKHRVFAVYFT